MLAFLFLSMVAAAGVSFIMEPASDGDVESAPEAETDETETETQQRDAEDPSNIDILDFAGPTTGTSGDDTITIDPGTVDMQQVDYAAYDGTDVQYYLHDDADPTLLEVDGGGGNDSFEINSGHALLTTGDGADTVDATGMQGGLIQAGEGDVVRGSDVALANNLAIKMDGAGQVNGGAANELIVAEGSGAVIDGGEGRDELLSVDGGADMRGGDGDDFIDANATDLEYDGTFDTSSGADAYVDRVDAGAGDDRVEDVSNGDIVTLGAGQDTAFALYDHGLADMGPVTFTDFEPEEDRAYLEIIGLPTPPDAAVYEDDYGNQIATLEGRVEVIEGDGDSHIFIDDELVAVFESTNGLQPEPYVTFDRYGDPDGIGVRFLPV